MTNLQVKLEKLVNDAIGKFNKYEHYLLVEDLSERCICSKLATYIERMLSKYEFEDKYDVDVEYNRMAGDEKRERSIDGKIKRMFADIIVHERDEKDNLICIEMKKQKNPECLCKDRHRLKEMTKQSGDYGYKIGFLIMVNNTDMWIEETFVDGQKRP